MLRENNGLWYRPWCLLRRGKIMTTSVRIFYHQGLVKAAVSNDGGRFSSDSVMMLQQPYIGSDMISCDNANVGATTGSNAGAGSLLARIEVQPGKSVYYEVNPPNRSVAASTSSPVISGQVVIPFGHGWSLSFLECDL